VSYTSQLEILQNLHNYPVPAPATSPRCVDNPRPANQWPVTVVALARKSGRLCYRATYFKCGWRRNSFNEFLSVSLRCISKYPNQHVSNSTDWFAM